MTDIRSILIFLATALLANVQGQCTSQAPINTGHYCFKYLQKANTYSEAVKRCSQSGAVVAHPAAQDFKTWVEDVRAVTRNQHSVWVGTTRNGSTWHWLNSDYFGNPIDTGFEGKHGDDTSIPDSAWGIGSDHKCQDKNETTGNETMTNSTMTNSTSTDADQPKYCQDSEKNCAYLAKNGKLQNVDCESFEQFYVLCQGPKDYSSACAKEQNCSENAYHYPISFNLCGCKCPDGYYGDGYNNCDSPGNALGIFLIFVIVIVGIIILLNCALAAKNTKEGKSLDGDALRKIWTTPIVVTIVGLVLILFIADVI